MATILVDAAKQGDDLAFEGLLERRGVLPITIAPVIAGLIANDAHAVPFGRLSGRGVALVRALQLALVALFGYSIARPHAAQAST